LTTWLSELLAQHQVAAGSAPAADDDEEPPKDIDEFRYALARRMDAFVDRHLAKQKAEAAEIPPHPTGDC
jgi:hypothetical protein